jgi:hypothetical protein
VGKIFTSLEDDGFSRLFLDFKYSSYRLEALQRYDVSYEKDEYSRFLAGEAQGESRGITGWIEGTVSRAISAGKRMHRVHVVEEPLSDYIRYEFGWAYQHSVAAGEEVRIIPVEAGQWPAEIPHYEYWLFDSSLLASMHYNGDGSFVSAEIIDEPEKVVRANYWRDAAIARSIPFHEYYSRILATRPE